jgi:hypothetical protein
MNIPTPHPMGIVLEKQRRDSGTPKSGKWENFDNYSMLNANIITKKARTFYTTYKTSVSQRRRCEPLMLKNGWIGVDERDPFSSEVILQQQQREIPQISR